MDLMIPGSVEFDGPVSVEKRRGLGARLEKWLKAELWRRAQAVAPLTELPSYRAVLRRRGWGWLAEVEFKVNGETCLATWGVVSPPVLPPPTRRASRLQAG